MKVALLHLLLCVMLALIPGLSSAADEDEATKAANEIITSIRDKNFEKLWNLQMSDGLKSQVTKDLFFTRQRERSHQLGVISNSVFIGMERLQTDRLTGFEGVVFAFKCRSSYTTGIFYEEIVIVKEKDGKFRLSGQYMAPWPE